MSSGEQKVANFTEISTYATDDYLMVLTDDAPANNVVQRISKENKIADDISADSGNLITQSATDKGLFAELADSGVTAGSYTLSDITVNAKGQITAASNGTVVITVMHFATCSTAGATAEKVVTLSGVTLAEGLTLIVEFDNANTSTTPTLTLNSETTKNIVNLRGAQFTTDNTFDNSDGERCVLVYDGTDFVLISAEFYQARMSMPDYARGVTQTANVDIVADADGEVSISATNSSGVARIYINSVMIAGVTGTTSGATVACSARVAKGDTYQLFDTGTLKNCKFYPLKGGA